MPAPNPVAARTDQPLANAAAAKAIASHGENEIPLLCLEACPRIVASARKIAKETFEALESARLAGA